MTHFSEAKSTTPRIYTFYTTKYMAQFATTCYVVSTIGLRLKKKTGMEYIHVNFVTGLEQHL